jgi:hypothetical protein
MDESRGWTFDGKEFVCGKRVEQLEDSKNLEASGLAQIRVPKDTGSGLMPKAATFNSRKNKQPPKLYVCIRNGVKIGIYMF